jgi:hypothetical protein
VDFGKKELLLNGVQVKEFENKKGFSFPRFHAFVEARGGFSIAVNGVSVTVPCAPFQNIAMGWMCSLYSVKWLSDSKIVPWL